MAEQIPIPRKADHRREILLLVILGFGSLAYSFGTMAMYAEPEEKPLEITLQSRPHTEPRRNEAGGPSATSRSDSKPAAVATESTAEAPPAVQPAPASAPAPAPAASPAPAAAPPRTESAPVAPAPAPTMAASTKPAATAPVRERVRVTRQRIGGEWVEVQDFTHGVEYRGEIHDFTSGQPPRWIQERERGSGR